MGSQTFIKEISAFAEGQAGLRTARIVALENNPEHPIINIAWDSGNGSFQISYEKEKEIKVFAGNIGGADVKALFMTEALGLLGNDGAQIEYQPLSLEQIMNFVTLLKEHFPEANESLQQVLIQEKGHVVTIGDRTSIFSLAQILLGKNIYTKAEVEQLLLSLVNRTEIDDLKVKYPFNVAFVVPCTSFLYAVMDKLKIDVIENYITAGNTKGLLATPELWED